MRYFNGLTKVYGIVGNPVSHSISPLFQNYFFQNSNINALYVPFSIEPENLASALSGLHASHIQGLNVTVPYKIEALHMASPDEAAKTIGAVNTLKRQASGWSATNTDWLGFSHVIEGMQINPEQTETLIFGAGGTTRAVVHALYHLGATAITICNRNTDNANKLISALTSSYPKMKIKKLEWDSQKVSDQSLKSKLIINSTSIGLKQEDIFPFTLSGKGVAIDVVYKPDGTTAFCKAAQNYQTIDGLPMLIAQGIESFMYWEPKDIEGNHITMPIKKKSLHWVESHLKRQHSNLPGWSI